MQALITIVGFLVKNITNYDEPRSETSLACFHDNVVALTMGSFSFAFYTDTLIALSVSG